MATLPTGVEPRCHSKSRRRWLFLLLATLLALGVVLFQWSILRSGGRIEFGRSSIVVPYMPPILAPDLAAEGVTLVDFRRHGHTESFVGFVRITRQKLILQLSTKDTALEPDSLSYALFDARGLLLSRGTVRSAARLALGETGDFEIVDANVSEAFQAVIERRE